MTETQNLYTNYAVLLQERAKMAKSIREYETLEEVQKTTILNTTQYYYRYIILLIVVCLLVVVLAKSFFFSGGQDIKGSILVVSIVLFVLTFMLHYINAYVFFLLCIASYLLFR
jgi:hypothetical protein